MDIIASRTGSVTVALALALGAGAAAFLAGGGRETAAPHPAEPIAVEVAGEALAVPAGLIRFADQRRAGRHHRLDLALAWPTLGSPPAHRAPSLEDTAVDPALIFVSIAPRDGTLDTAGRLATVYGRFFTGAPIDGPGGLVGRRMASGSGYDDEIVFFEPGAVRPFAARCFAAERGRGADLCLREIAAGRNLTVTYRFRAALLGDWQRLDERIRALVEGFSGA